MGPTFIIPRPGQPLLFRGLYVCFIHFPTFLPKHYSRAILRVRMVKFMCEVSAAYSRVKTDSRIRVGYIQLHPRQSPLAEHRPTTPPTTSEMTGSENGETTGSDRGRPLRLISYSGHRLRGHCGTGHRSATQPAD